MLHDVDFKPVYASGEDEPAEFFLEGLINSQSLDLGLGYFSSSGFRALAIGFAFFIKRGGKMRIIINDVLSQEDKEAILEGNKQKSANTVEKAILDDILILKDTLSKKDKHFFKCLSWLIATNRLEIKASIPKKSKVGIVHQKFGLFRDYANNIVAFSGSINFSANGIYNNIEAISCDLSWDSGTFGHQRIKQFESIFHKTWTGLSEVVELIPIDRVKTIITEEFAVRGMKELLDEELELAQEEVNESNVPVAYANKISELITKLQPTTLKIKSQSDLPALREYQEEAIRNWKDNEYCGLLEMATGTGKTFTALAATWELIREKEKLFIIISCPFIHLAEQWQEEAKKFGFDSILVGESRHLWEEETARQAQLFKRGKLDRVVLVTTNASFSSEHFQKIIKPCIADTLLIIDEAHYAGAVSIRSLLPDCPYRLGLSATPERHGDPEGTQALLEYFDSVVFSFPIEQAIGKFLTPYYYHAIPVELTEAEFTEYCSLSEQMVKFTGRDDEESRDRLQKLAIKRARIQNNSKNKILWIEQNIHNKPINFSLFYAGEQIFDQVKMLLGKHMKIKLHEFTSRQTRAQRRNLLKDFADQKIQSLIAMKCLDEGVDVPPTRVAYFLASSSNPREFVQRRGRVLRKSEGKDYALIYDLISVPPRKFIEQGRKGKEYYAVKSAFIKEYKRVQEFASMAINQYESIQELYDMADQLDLLDVTKK